MDTLLDRRGVKFLYLVMNDQARAGRIRPDRQDTGLSTERQFDAVRNTSILMQGRNAQPQAPARLMAYLHHGSVPIDSALINTGAILRRIILDNKFPGDRAVSDAAGLLAPSHRPETSFHRRLSSDPASPASPSRKMVPSTQPIAARQRSWVTPPDPDPLADGLPPDNLADQDPRQFQQCSHGDTEARRATRKSSRVLRVSVRDLLGTDPSQAATSGAMGALRRRGSGATLPATRRDRARPSAENAGCRAREPRRSPDSLPHGPFQTNRPTDPENHPWTSRH